MPFNFIFVYFLHFYNFFSIYICYYYSLTSVQMDLTTLSCLLRKENKFDFNLRFSKLEQKFITSWLNLFLLYIGPCLFLYLFCKITFYY